MKLLLRSLAVLLLAASASAANAAGASYPDRPVRLIVPYLPGGTPDIMARLISPKLTEMWGHRVIVENRAGVNGVTGSAEVAKAEPDGYTLVLGTTATHVVDGFLYSKMPYDGSKDFAPITMIGTLSNILVVNPAVPAKNLRELIALLKSKPGQINFGSGGNGSSSHLGGEMFKTMAGVDMVHVPYKSGAPALIDLVGGHVAMIFENIPTALPHIQSGRLRPIAVTSGARANVLPEVPTMDEAGVPGFEMSFWYGVLAPAGTPAAVIGKLNADIVKVLAMPEVRESLVSRGIDVAGNAPAQFAARISSEVPKWSKVIKDAGVKLD